MNWFMVVLKKYADFTGRARRSEYWYFFLIYIGIAIVLGIIDGMIGSTAFGNLGLLSGLLLLGLFLPSIAVAVRRLHDIGKSGWWLLLGFVPIVGGLVLLYFAFQDSQPGVNLFGPNPKNQLAAPEVNPA
jgi:uncharacterized membrane protein YhaH (DUF805 family)